MDTTSLLATSALIELLNSLDTVAVLTLIEQYVLLYCYDNFTIEYGVQNIEQYREDIVQYLV
ncbi:hypothetical protein AVEN_51084-1, partial [Araneus ventricosus]